MVSCVFSMPIYLHSVYLGQHQEKRSYMRTFRAVIVMLSDLRLYTIVMSH